MPDSNELKGKSISDAETQGATNKLMEDVFSLGRFETLVYARQYEPATHELMRLLRMLDATYGVLDQRFQASITADLPAADVDLHVFNRICCALTALFSDPAFSLTAQGSSQLFLLHRWVSTLFATTPFRNADHILRALNLKGPDAAEVTVREDQLVKFCILYTPNSEISLDIDAVWAFDRNMAASLACALLSPRFLGTPAAHGKREMLLHWLTSKLDQIEDIDLLPVGILHDVYMHCSYADDTNKHAIKASINRLIRKKLVQQELCDIPLEPKERAPDEKPLMLVVLEWFTGSHSVYRTHSASIDAARQQFRVVGVGWSEHVDDLARKAFDEFIPVEGSVVPFIRDLADRLRPDLVYYPSFGMFPLTIFLTNLRLAPVQVVSYGHPATSQSPFIDYFVLPEDWVGSPSCFSERLLPLPAGAMPFVPTASCIDLLPNLRRAPETIRIAVCATTMKLNPRFMRTLGQIQQQSKRPIEIHFYLGMSQGAVYLEARQFIQVYLPNAVINGFLPYAEYMKRINDCDLFLNPFPFGNTNGIVDVASLGMVGVCKTGPEVLEHIDEAMFARLGLPDWLVAQTEEEYVQAALKLIADDQLRLSLRRKMLAGEGAKTFYQGQPELFGQAFLELLPGKAEGL